MANIAPVGTPTAGAGLWGQLDMAGEVWEWNLDWFGGYVAPCTDCAYLMSGLRVRVVRGGGFDDALAYLSPSTAGTRTRLRAATMTASAAPGLRDPPPAVASVDEGLCPAVVTPRTVDGRQLAHRLEDVRAPNGGDYLAISTVQTPFSHTD